MPIHSIIAIFLIIGTATLVRAEEKERENPLAHTPFADKWERLKLRPNVIGIGPSKDQVEGIVARQLIFRRYSSSFPYCYVHLIEECNLYEELQITSRQRKLLRVVQSPTGGSVTELLTGKQALPALDPKRFRSFIIEKWYPTAKKANADSNAKVEEILDLDQMTRLRQLGFQFFLTNYTLPKGAFAYHDRKLTEAEEAKLHQAFRNNRAKILEAERALVYREQCKVLASVVGGGTFDESVGELFDFSTYGTDGLEILELLDPAQAKTSTSNPRRGKK